MRAWFLPTFLFAMALPAIAMAQTAPVDDPTHGFCFGSSTCSTLGNITNITGTTVQFGFEIAPGGQTGDFRIVIAVPTELDPTPATQTFVLDGAQTGVNDTGTITGASSAFLGIWNNGFLTDFLGITNTLANGSPKQPLSNFTGTQGCGSNAGGACNPGDPNATAFDIYVVDLGQNQLIQQGTVPGVPALNFDSTSATLPKGSVLFGLLNTGTATNPSWVTPAQSSALDVDADCTNANCSPTPFQSVPEPASLAVMGVGLLGMLGIRRRRA